MVVTEARDPSAVFSLRSRPARIPRAFRRDAWPHHSGDDFNQMRDSAGLSGISGIPQDRRRPPCMTLTTTAPTDEPTAPPQPTNEALALVACARLRVHLRAFLHLMARWWRSRRVPCTAPSPVRGECRKKVRRALPVPPVAGDARCRGKTRRVREASTWSTKRTKTILSTESARSSIEAVRAGRLKRRLCRPMLIMPGGVLSSWRYFKARPPRRARRRRRAGRRRRARTPASNLRSRRIGRSAKRWSLWSAVDRGSSAGAGRLVLETQ